MKLKNQINKYIPTLKLFIYTSILLTPAYICIPFAVDMSANSNQIYLNVFQLADLIQAIFIFFIPAFALILLGHWIPISKMFFSENKKYDLRAYISLLVIQTLPFSIRMLKYFI